MKKYILFSLLIFISLPFYSQIVTIIDETNLEPIENVIIYGKSKYVMTDKYGKADISNFDKSSNFIFKHTSFVDLHLTFSDIKKLNFQIMMVESALDLNEVVISANSWEQNKNEVSNRIKIISKRSIANANFQTTADLLKLSGEVFIQKSQLGGGSPMIRGFSANRILLVVDGVRMNNAVFRSGNLQNVILSDAHSIESSEVILGSGSVIYGSDAIGGVIDFHFLKPKFSSKKKLYFTSNFLSEFSSADVEKTGHLDFNIGTRKFASLTSFSYSDYDDLKMGKNGGHDEYLRKEYVKTVNGIDLIIPNENSLIQKYSVFSQLNFLQRFSWKISDKLKADYGFFFSESSDIPRYDRLLQYKSGQLKYAEWYYGPQKWMMHNLKLKFKKNTKLFDNMKFITAFQNYSESRHDRKFGESEIRERYENVKALSFNLDFVKYLSDKFSVFYGSEAVLNKIFSRGEMRNIFSGVTEISSGRYPNNSNYSSYAAYFSFKNNLSDNLTINSGIRYNRIYADAELNTSFYNFPVTEINLNTGALNGSVGITYRPQTWLFKFNAGTGFRAPNIDDMAKIFDSEPGNVVVPNDKLKPEYIYNADLGISKTFLNKFQIDISAFWSYLNNALIRGDYTFNGADSIMYDGEMSKVQAVINADFANVYGFNVSLNADISKIFSVKSTYNYSKGKDSFNKPLRHVPPAFGTAHFIFKTNKIRADFFAEYNAEVSFINLADSERDKIYMYTTDNEGNPYSPAWCTLNLNISYQLNKNFRLKGGIENITDLQYRPYSSGIVAPGRNYFFTLSAAI